MDIYIYNYNNICNILPLMKGNILISPQQIKSLFMCILHIQFFFCGELTTAETGDTKSFLTIRANHFIDSKGHQVILHGLNIVSKNPATNYKSWHGPEDFKAMHDWGMNCVRLGIIWDGIEPKPGEYDEAYLDAVAQQVKWAKDAGLYVFLDMHQDLFSVKYSDGAPEWATLDEGKPHLKGNVWSDSYLISPAVHAAFDNFWANAPAPDGIGIQDHYIAVWKHVAERFQDNPTIIGYDIMNEPFEGSAILAGQLQLLISDFAQALEKKLGATVAGPQQLMDLWMSDQGRKTITAQLNDINLYTAFVDAQEDFSQQFEREHVQPMYQRVANAIRTVDTQHFLILETSYRSNSGVYSGLEPVVGPDRKRDPLQVYAPHAYDIVVDTPDLAQANSARVELIFNRHYETTKKLEMPMLIGEYGAFGGWNEQILPSARGVQRMLEQLNCSDTYWDYGRDIQERAYFPTLCRPIPVHLAGTLIEYRSDPEKMTFNCHWKENTELKGDTIIYLPKSFINNRNIQVTPKGKGFHIKQTSNGAYLHIPSTYEDTQRSLTVF